MDPGPNYTLGPTFNDAEILPWVIEEHVTCRYHHWTLGGSRGTHWLRNLVPQTITEVDPGPNYTLGPTFNDAEILPWVIEEHVTCWYHHWTLGGSRGTHWLRNLVPQTITEVDPGPNYTLGPTFNDAEILPWVIEEHVTCWYHHWTLGGSRGTHWLRNLVPQTITEVDPGPNYTLGPTFNDAEILPWVIEEHVTCWYHHWTLGGSRGTHWLRNLVPQTITEVDPGPNYTLGPTFNDAEILPWVIEEHVTCRYHHWTLGGSRGTHWLRNLVPQTITEVDPGPNYTLGPTFNDAEILPWVIEEHVTCWYHHWTLGGSRGTHWLRNLVPQTITEVNPSPNYTLGPTFNDAEILPWVIEEHVTCWYHHWTLGGSRGTHWLRNMVPQTITEVDPGPNYTLGPTFNDAEILPWVIEEHVTCWYHHWTLGGSRGTHWLRNLVPQTITEVDPGPNYTLGPTFNDAEILPWVIEEHVTCWYHHWTLGGSRGTHWLRNLVPQTITEVDPGPNYTLGPTFNDAEILPWVIEEHVTCWYHHWTLGGSRGTHWLRNLVPQTITEVDPGPNYTLGPTFNDAEILPWVIEEHVTCWYHHWTLGGSRGTHWLRNLVPQTITEVDPGPNYTLGPTFNDAEILPWVIEEHVTCWYHHWTLGGSRGTHWLRNLVPQTITEVDPGPNYTLGPTFNDAEILPWVIEEHVTCRYHHWTLGGSRGTHWLRNLVPQTITEVDPGPNYTLGPTFNDAEILPWVIEEHVTCWYHHWTLGGSRGTHWLRNLVPQTITEVDPGPNYTLGPTFNDAEILPWVIEEHVTCWYHHWTLGGSRGTHWLRNLVPQTITEVNPGPNYTLGPTFNDAEILPWVIEEHVTCWYHHWTLGGSRGTHWLRNLVPQTITEVDPGPNYTLGPTFNDAEILPWVIEEHVTCRYHHWTLGGSRGTHWLRNLVPQTITEVDPGPNYTLGPTFNDAEILPWVIEEHVTCWYHHWTLGGSRGTHWLRNLVPQTITEVNPSPNYTLGPTFNDAEILPWVIEEHVTCWYHHWTLGGSRGTHWLRNLVPQTITEVDPGPNYTLGQLSMMQKSSLG